jgi:hypothetical protein
MQTLSTVAGRTYRLTHLVDGPFIVAEDIAQPSRCFVVQRLRGRIVAIGTNETTQSDEWLRALLEGQRPNTQ